MADFQINITSDASSVVSAAAQAKQALEGTAEATRQAADDSERYQKALEQMSKRDALAGDGGREDQSMVERAYERKLELARQNIATKAYEEQASTELAGAVHTATKEEIAEAEATIKTTGSKRSLLTALKTLGTEFPMLGSAARIALNPLVGIAFAASMAFQKITADLRQLNESLTTSEWEGYGTVLSAQQKGLADAALSAAKYADEMERLATAQDSASQGAEKLMTVFKSQMNAEDRLDESRKRMELAKASGEKDPVRRAQQELEIEERYAGRKRQRDEQAAIFERNEQHRKLANETINAQVLGGQVEKARQRAAALGTEEAVTARIQVERSNLAKTEAELAQKQDRANALRDLRLITPPQADELQALDQQIESLGALRLQQRGYLGKLEGRAPGQIAAIRSAQSQVTLLEGMQTGAIQRAEGIRGMMPTQEAVQDNERRTRAGEALLGSLTRAQTALNTGKSAESQVAEEIARSLESGKGVTEAMLQKLQEYRASNVQMEARIRSLENTRKANPPGI